MLRRLGSDARRAVLFRAQEEAKRLGSPTVEAEHLLLALSRDNGTAGKILEEAGLDHQGLVVALDSENQRALAAVGISLDAFALPPLTPHSGNARLATSAKQALARGIRAAAARGDRSILSGHLLLGLLRADAGVLPRVLEATAVDRFELLARTEGALDREL